MRSNSTRNYYKFTENKAQAIFNTAAYAQETLKITFAQPLRIALELEKRVTKIITASGY